MALDFDVPTAPTNNSPNSLDPAETIRPLTLSDLGEGLHTAAQVRPLTIKDLGDGLAQGIGVDVTAPAPNDLNEARDMLHRLQYERAVFPEEKGGAAITQLPAGSAADINYGPAPDDQGSNWAPLSAIGAQGGMGIMAAGGALAKQAGGLFNDPVMARQGSLAEQQMEQLGNESPGPNIVRHLTSSIVDMAPKMLAGTLGGLPGLALAFGASAYGEGKATAEEQGYANPNAYALVSGLIGAGTALIPGYKGANVIAKAASLTESKPWASYLSELVGKYATGKLWQTHGGAGAIQGAIQSTLQGLVNKETINPDLTWTDIVQESLAAAGMGGLLGEGFGAVHHAEANSIHKATVNDLFKHFEDYIQNSDMQGGTSELRTHYPNWDARAPVAGSLPPQEQPTLAPIAPEPESSLRTIGRPNLATKPPAELFEPTPEEPIVPKLEPITSDRGPQPYTPAGERPVTLTPQPVTGQPVDRGPVAYTPEDFATYKALTTAVSKTDSLDDKQALFGAIVKLVNKYQGRKPMEPVTQQPVTSDRGPQPYVQATERPVTLAPKPLPTVDEALVTPEPVAEKPTTPRLSTAVEPQSSLKPIEATQPDTTGKLQTTEKLPVGPEVKAFGENFVAERNLRGKVQLRERDHDHALAEFKGRSTKGFNETELLTDVQRFSRGEATKYWEIRDKVPNNPLLRKVNKDTKAGVTAKNVEDLAANTAAMMKKTPVDRVLATWLGSGNLSEEGITQFVGKKIAAEGPRKVAQALRARLKTAVNSYLDGSMLTRENVGEERRPLPELQKTVKDPVTGEDTLVPKTEVEIRAMHPDEQSLVARALDLMVRNRTVDLEASDQISTAKKTAEPLRSVSTREHDETGITKEVVSETKAETPVQTTGLTDESLLTRFSDEDLKTKGKHDPAKVAAAEELEEMRQRFAEGDQSVHDDVKATLVETFGKTEAEADRWLDNADQPYLAPDKQAELLNSSGPIRTAQAADFNSPEELEFYRSHGLLAGTFDVPIRKIAEGTGPYAKLAGYYLRWQKELATVSLGNLGGSVAGSHYTAEGGGGGKVKIRLGLDINQPDVIDEIVLHEAVHALTLRRLETLGPDSPEYKELKGILDRAKASGEQLPYFVNYSVKNVHELLAMGSTNPQAREFFKAMAEAKGGFLAELWNWFKRLLGIHTQNAADQVDSLLRRVLSSPVVSNADWVARTHERALANSNYPERLGKSDRDKGPLRSAEEQDFKTKAQYRLYKKMGLLADNHGETPDLYDVLSTVKNFFGDQHTHLTALADVLTDDMRFTYLDAIGIPVGTLGGEPGRGTSYHNGARKQSVKISREYTDPQEVLEAILHEAVHALTIRKLEIAGEKSAEYQELVNIQKQGIAYLRQLSPEAADYLEQIVIPAGNNETSTAPLQRSMDQMPDDMWDKYGPTMYALSHPYELLSNGTSNPSTIKFLRSAPYAGEVNNARGSLWDNLKRWFNVRIWPRLSANVRDQSLLAATHAAFERVLELPEPSDKEWRDHSAAEKTKTPDRQTFGYPEIRNPSQYEQVRVHRGDDLDQAEREQVTRKAVVQNNWVEHPEIAHILVNSPEDTKSMLKTFFGDRLQVINDAKHQPDYRAGMSYAGVMADPQVSDGQKSDIRLSTMHNLLNFEDRLLSWQKKLANQYDKLQKRLPLLDKGIDEANAQMKGVDNAVKDIIGAFKERILQEKAKATDEEKLASLNKMRKMVDEVIGNRSAVSKLLGKVADEIPVEMLADQTDPKGLLALIKNLFPIGEASTVKLGVNEDTQRIAAWAMANANNLREQLLDIKLLRQPNAVRNAISLDEGINADLRQNDMNKALVAATSKVFKQGIKQGDAERVYKLLFREKSRMLGTIRKMLSVQDTVLKVRNTPSFKALEKQVYVDNGVMRPIRYLGNKGELLFTHPLTRDTVTINPRFESEADLKEMTKLQELAASAAQYIANPEFEHYDVREAAAWKEFLKNTSFLLDPTTSVMGGALRKAAYDPYRAMKLMGGVFNVPSHILQGIGGRAAAEAEVSYQAINAVKAQLLHLKTVHGPVINETARLAAKAHNLSEADWDREVLNPYIDSRQTTGTGALKVGDTTLYGHTILPADERAFNAQKTLNRKNVHVSTTGQGNTAVGFDPSRVDFKGPGGKVLTRKVMLTSDDTMSRRLAWWTHALATGWGKAGEVADQIAFLNDNFLPVVMGHLNTVGRPDYSVRSSQASIYRDAIREHKRNPFDNMDDLLDFLSKAQADHVDPEQEVSKEVILKRMTDELDKVFQNVSGFQESEAKAQAGAVVNAMDTDNSYTAPRGKLIAPGTFYDYSLTYDRDRIAAVQSGQHYYMLKLAGKNGDLDRLSQALDAQRQDFEKQIREEVKKNKVTEEEAAKNVEKATRSKQIDGKLLLTYAETTDALAQVNGLRAEVARLMTSKASGTDESALIAANSVQSFAATNVLAGQQSRNRHFTTGMMNLMLFNKVVMGRSMALEAVRQGWRMFLTQGPKELASMTIGAGPVGKVMQKVVRQPIFWRAGEWFGKAIEVQVQMHRDMERLGIAPTANVMGDLHNLWSMPLTGGQPRSGRQTKLSQLGHGVESALRAESIPLGAVTLRPVDRFLNGVLAGLKVDDIENMLKISSVRAGAAREATGAGRGVFTPAEVFRQRGASDKQDIMFRNLFHSGALNLDSLMWRYFDAHKAEGKAASFFTPEERETFKFMFAQNHASLPVFSNRPSGTRGSRTRNAAGLFWGYPAWLVSHLSQTFGRTAADASTGKHIPSTIAGLFLMAAVGAAATANNSFLKKTLYGETSPNPSILDAHNATEVGHALAAGLAGFTPFFVGAAINGILENNPNGTGFDVNSQFVMLNIANDIFNTMRKLVQEGGTSTRPLTDFARRWSPLSRIVIDRLPGQAGITEYYNAARDIKNLAPEGMETRKRGGGAFDATPATPIMQDMINAAYRGDDAGFAKAQDRFQQYQSDLGKTPDEAQKSLQSAWRARSPFMLEFGRLPTAREEAEIYERANPTQRAGLDKAVQVFQSYGQQLGTTVPETREEPGQGGGLRGGGGGSAPLDKASSALLGSGGLATPEFLGGSAVGGMRHARGSGLSRAGGLYPSASAVPGLSQTGSLRSGGTGGANLSRAGRGLRSSSIHRGGRVGRASGSLRVSGSRPHKTGPRSARVGSLRPLRIRKPRL